MRRIYWAFAGVWLPFVPLEASAQGRPSHVGTEGNRPAFDSFFLGGHLGAMSADSPWTADGPAGGFSGHTSYKTFFNGFSASGNYTLGLQAGANKQLPNGVVLGLVADMNFPNTVAGTSPLQSAALGTATADHKVLSAGSLRGRLGYAFHTNAFLYGTAGYAWSYDELVRTQQFGTPAGGTVAAGDDERTTLFRSGYVVGAGIESRLTQNWSTNAEYLYTHFGYSTVQFHGGAQAYRSELDAHSLRLGLNYNFGSFAEAAAEGFQPKPVTNNNWALHGQSTYVQQFSVPFRSPYTGPNSFLSGQGRQTWDATAYVGMRPWGGAEVWFNPEIDQGFGLSNTLGIAGYVSGEAYKLGAADPYARLPRAFLRQTINLAGGAEKVEAAPNQLKGSQSENRVVVTVGKFGVADVFDTNKYAHDPRTDFLNWSVLDTGSFDYAADAWGFTYGGAVEWYQNKWVFRVGLFDLPTMPNSTALDPSFGQFQWVGEIEKRYELGGQPGKVAVTGFVTRSRMARYDDAVALGAATGQTPTLASVREFSSRTGISMNAEQQLNAHLGVFFRAGVSDGTKEPFAFTQIDNTVAAGVNVNGRSWGRPNDTLGFAGVINDISGAHKAYLNAGGLGILLGDGQLARPGKEKIVETYYSYAIKDWRITLDHQLIENPGYNQDRGPVSVIGARVRSQF